MAGSHVELLNRIAAEPERVVYLVGSAITAPQHPGMRGVPRIDGVITTIQDGLHPTEQTAFEQALASLSPAERYQKAFAFILRNRGQDAANRVIRACVLQARRDPPPIPIPASGLTREACKRLERDLDGWDLPPAVAALGTVLAGATASTTAQPTVLTSNFDPLISVAIRRAGGHAFSSAPDGDGSLRGNSGEGTHIIHFHGDWCRTDTLHLGDDLAAARPQLGGSIKALLRERTLVVLGYGGWDDIILRSLDELSSDAQHDFEIAWAFFWEDEDRIRRDNARLFSRLDERNRRIQFYTGVDAHLFLPALAARMHADRASLRPHVSPRPPVPSQPTVPVQPTIPAQRTAPPQPTAPTQPAPPAPPPVKFNPVGTIPLGHPSYIRRSSDDEAEQYAEEPVPVLVRGHWAMGKSSFLLRLVDRWQQAGRATCLLDLYDFPNHDPRPFFAKFYNKLSESLGTAITDWEQLRTVARARSLLLAIDELGGPSSDVAPQFFPPLIRNALDPTNGIHLVATLRMPLAELLAHHKLASPNFVHGWREVILEKFTPPQFLQLSALLPVPVQVLVAPYQQKIREHSEQYTPDMLQKLFDRLRQKHVAGRPYTELTSMLDLPESYR